uniref:endonuclease domain-containing 1 protein-like n=1 Tax=Scatophagus argus TaxID=75038 RepID=UPI001ED8164B|nr:endonuclease domain-containing 1 protein-like [Scatophagus argus]
MRTYLKRRCLLGLAALLLLLLLCIPTVAEVVSSLSNCNQFLLKGTPPEIPGILTGGIILNESRYKPICQTFMNQRRFVTLYDTQNRIPVFSAYKYRGKGPATTRPPWRIEPQVRLSLESNMIAVDNNATYDNQAANADYRNNRRFDRGHLLPNSYGFTSEDKWSTFTLTNVVPQESSFNQGSWKGMEECVKCIMDKHCVNNNGVTEGFVVIGAQASANDMLRNRVNIPYLMWSAFCCYSSRYQDWIASAHWARNVPDRADRKHLQTRPLKDLHRALSTVDSKFEVFPRTQCPLDKIISNFNPRINAEQEECFCPRQTTTTTAPPTSTTSTGFPSTTATTTTTTTEHQTTASPSTTTRTTTTTSATSVPTTTTTTTTTTTSTRTTKKDDNSGDNEDSGQGGNSGGSGGGGGAGGGGGGGGGGGAGGDTNDLHSYNY